MIHRDNYPGGYPGPGSVGNLIGARDKIGFHYDSLRQRLAQAAMRGEPVEDAAVRALNDEEVQMRQEHAAGQRVSGFTVVNGLTANRNSEARRLHGAMQAFRLILETEAVGPSVVDDDPDMQISGGNRIIHIAPDGSPGDFDGMILGRHAGDSIPGFEPGFQPVLLIPEDRLKPAA